MSGAEDSTAKLFARASSLLIGAKADAIGDHDAREMLRALDYAVPESASPGDRISPETANRAHLLDVASRFARVFELAAPDAPGLIAFGAQFDPVPADPLHQGSPLVGVSGVGLSLQQAFQSCIGRPSSISPSCKTEATHCSSPASVIGRPGSARRRSNLLLTCRNAARGQTAGSPGIAQRG